MTEKCSGNSFTNVSADAATIKAFLMKPPYPEIKVHGDIVSRNQVKCICRRSIRFQQTNPYRSLTKNMTKQIITDR